MDKLVESCWAHFKTQFNNYLIVKPSIPVLYFGDRKAYDKSALKIVTVGKNPSSEEFPNNNCFSRFKGGEYLYNLQNLDGRQNDYFDILNKYFQVNPYDWFDNYEFVLNGLGCSYYSNKIYSNISLHTDLCSPMATTSGWTKIKDTSTKNLLKKYGIVLWHSLINLLKPDVLLISMAGNYKDEIELSNLYPWKQFYEFTHFEDGRKRNQNYRVYETKYMANGNKTIIGIYGAGGVFPFQLITHHQKKVLGRVIKENIIK